jgi:hypothetical protein
LGTIIKTITVPIIILIEISLAGYNAWNVILKVNVFSVNPHARKYTNHSKVENHSCRDDSDQTNEPMSFGNHEPMSFGNHRAIFVKFTRNAVTPRTLTIRANASRKPPACHK